MGDGTMGFWDRKLTQIWKDEIVVRVRWRGWCIDQWLKRRDPLPSCSYQTHVHVNSFFFSFLFFNEKNKIIGYVFFCLYLFFIFDWVFLKALLMTRVCKWIFLPFSFFGGSHLGFRIYLWDYGCVWIELIFTETENTITK